MREIKFRAWTEDYLSDEEGKMHMDYRLELNNEPGISLNTILTTNKYRILMQFTGLKDKNGVEIYEGDLLKLGKPLVAKHTKSPFLPLADENEVIEVLFDTDNAKFVTEEGDLGDVHKWHMIEVIGNIYENPELLEETNG